jgi:YcxB-like protein
MTETVNLSFRYSEGDFVRATRSSYASRMHPACGIVLVVVIGALGIYLQRLHGWRSLGTVLVGAAEALVIVLWLIFVIIPRSSPRLDPRVRDVSVTLSAEGVHFRTLDFDSQLKWSFFSRALVDAHSYILYHKSRPFTVIPKRVIESSEQQKAFEELLSHNVSKIVIKK